MKELAQQYPGAESILLVQDNLNTHTAGSFYEALTPDEAFELRKRFELPYESFQSLNSQMIWHSFQLIENWVWASDFFIIDGQDIYRRDYPESTLVNC